MSYLKEARVATAKCNQKENNKILRSNPQRGKGGPFSISGTKVIMKKSSPKPFSILG